jgi:hypothetical protein
MDLKEPTTFVSPLVLLFEQYPCPDAFRHIAIQRIMTSKRSSFRPMCKASIAVGLVRVRTTHFALGT